MICTCTTGRFPVTHLCIISQGQPLRSIRACPSIKSCQSVRISTRLRLDLWQANKIGSVMHNDTFSGGFGMPAKIWEDLLIFASRLNNFPTRRPSRPAARDVQNIVLPSDKKDACAILCSLSPGLQSAHYIVYSSKWCYLQVLKRVRPSSLGFIQWLFLWCFKRINIKAKELTQIGRFKHFSFNESQNLGSALRKRRLLDG